MIGNTGKKINPLKIEWRGIYGIFRGNLADFCGFFSVDLEGFSLRFRVEVVAKRSRTIWGKLLNVIK